MPLMPKLPLFKLVVSRKANPNSNESTSQALLLSLQNLHTLIGTRKSLSTLMEILKQIKPPSFPLKIER